MGESFGPIKRTRVAEILANEIKQKILKGMLKCGDKLPSERELAKQCSTSRITVRESFRMLENEGLLQIRQGADGGAFIAETNYKNVMRQLNVFYEYGYLSLDKLLEARRIVEPEVARLSARNRTEDDIDELEKIIHRCQVALDRKQPEADLQLQFHCLIAKASQNPLLIAVSNSLIRFLGEKMLKPSSDRIYQHYVDDQKFHQKIFLAINNKDQEGAYREMKKHVQVFDYVFRSNRGLSQN
jgi:DNA-binding FadR family transcriptional regulator